jgi:hypothetical protein
MVQAWTRQSKNQSLPPYEYDMSIVVERIQAQKICNVGHLLGYHAKATNMENLASAIQMQPGMQNIAVEVRAEFIKFGTSKQPLALTKKYSSYTPHGTLPPEHVNLLSKFTHLKPAGHFLLEFKPVSSPMLVILVSSRPPQINLPTPTLSRSTSSSCKAPTPACVTPSSNLIILIHVLA